LVEQLIRNQQVTSSSLVAGSNLRSRDIAQSFGWQANLRLDAPRRLLATLRFFLLYRVFGQDLRALLAFFIRQVGSAAAAARPRATVGVDLRTLISLQSLLQWAHHAARARFECERAPVQDAVIVTGVMSVVRASDRPIRLAKLADFCARAVL
jgi:hypothetical protein